MTNVLNFQHCCILFFGLNFAFDAVVFKNINSRDSDQTAEQTAEQSDVGPRYLHMPFCQHLWCTNV